MTSCPNFVRKDLPGKYYVIAVDAKFLVSLSHVLTWLPLNGKYKSLNCVLKQIFCEEWVWLAINYANDVCVGVSMML